jgi:hypothetical protein
MPVPNSHAVPFFQYFKRGVDVPALLAYLHIPRLSEDMTRSISYADHGLCKAFYSYTW